MALIKCTECGCELSEYADKCPKCGCPTKIILENIRNKQESTNASPILVNSTKNESTHKSRASRNKRLVIMGILIVCAIIFIVLIRKPSIADISIDKVTPELKSAVQKYDKLDDFSEGLAAVCKDNKWGFIDKLGKEIIPCKYDKVDDFCCGVCVVGANEKLGIINKYGESVTPIIYDFIDSFSSIDSLARASLGGRQGILNNYGNVIIPFEYDEIFNFNEGLALAKKDNKYGCIDKSNKVVIPFKYDGKGFENGFSDGLIALEKDGDYGYLDKQGNVVIPFDKKFNGSPFSSGFATISKGGIGCDVVNGNIVFRTPEPFMMAFIDKTGKQVTDFCECEYKGFRNGYCVVEDGRTRLSGLIDSYGNMVVPAQYLFVASGWIKDDLVCVMSYSRKKGFVDLRTGHLIIPCEYEGSGFFFSEGLCFVEKNGRCGYINMSNQIEIPLIYDCAHDFHEGFAVVERYGKYGYVDRYGTDTFN